MAAATFLSNTELIKKIYTISLEKKRYDLSLFLLKNSQITDEFSFLGPTFDEFLESRSFNKIPLPFFKTYEMEYEFILRVLFKTSETSPFKKRIGLALKAHGIPLINNLFALRSFTDIHRDLDKVLALDHSKALSYEVYDLFKDHGGLLHLLTRDMPLTRVFIILLNFDLSLYADTETMIERIKSSEHLEDFKTKILPTIKTLKTLHEIHDTLLEFIFLKDIPEKSRSPLPPQNLPLNQDILFLDGLTVKDLTISVPKTTKELKETGLKLRHCVGLYSEKVVSKKSQILNLKKGNLLLYTLELKKAKDGYTITQFKGKHNSNFLEGPKGQLLREKITKLVNGIED